MKALPSAVVAILDFTSVKPCSLHLLEQFSPSHPLAHWQRWEPAFAVQIRPCWQGSLSQPVGCSQVSPFQPEEQEQA